MQRLIVENQGKKTPRQMNADRTPFPDARQPRLQNRFWSGAGDSGGIEIVRHEKESELPWFAFEVGCICDVIRGWIRRTG